MTYPQPNTADPVLNSQDFFRLNTRLVSPGDIYESEVTALACALGPDSDIARVNVAYFDETQPTLMNVVTISPSRLFNGTIIASKTDKYAPSGNPARILIWPEDIFDINFVPFLVAAGGGAATPAGYTEFIRPQLDVIQYFSNVPSLPPARNDKEWTFQELRINTPLANGNIVAYVFPYYGRKYASIEIANCSADTIHVGINGVTYAYSNDAINQNLQHTQTVLTQATDLVHTTANQGSLIPAVGLATGLKRIVTAAADGMFDALVVMVQFDSVLLANSHNIPLKVIVSDSPR